MIEEGVGEEGLFSLRADFVLVWLNVHVRVYELTDGSCSRVGLELLNVGLTKEELTIKVGLLDEIVIRDCDQARLVRVTCNTFEQSKCSLKSGYILGHLPLIYK